MTFWARYLHHVLGAETNIWQPSQEAGQPTRTWPSWPEWRIQSDCAFDVPVQNGGIILQQRPIADSRLTAGNAP